MSAVSWSAVTMSAASPLGCIEWHLVGLARAAHLRRRLGPFDFSFRFLKNLGHHLVNWPCLASTDAAYQLCGRADRRHGVAEDGNSVSVTVATYVCTASAMATKKRRYTRTTLSAHASLAGMRAILALSRYVWPPAGGTP